jgi:hypothetical protein
MRDPEERTAALARSKFRGRFRLGPKERTYLESRTLAVVLEHGRQFLLDRLAPAAPRNDGRQTPMRGHPIFVAQHATATCCRKCLARWHRIPAGRPLAPEEIDYVLDVLRRWLVDQSGSFP